jgi:DNA-binding winged helix-turn-helix (wHTH) protein/tetratricopeptide (TPR) repeat protein
MSDRYRFGPFELDAAEHSLLAQGRQVALTRRAFDTLLYLVRHPGRLVTRDELIAAVWGQTIVEEGNLHWTISAVRKALAQESGEAWIETVRGLGYRFLGTVENGGEEVAQEIPSPAAPAPAAPVTMAPVPIDPVLIAPRRRPWRLWLAAGLGAVLLATGGAWRIAGRPDIASASKPQSVAVVGFRNLSPGGAGGWVGTALTEMLTADLGHGGSLRTVSSDDVASMRRDLGLRPDAPLGTSELAQIQRRLGSEWVLAGSYVLLEGQDQPLRVDVLLRHAGTGETRVATSRRGREQDLFALTDSLAGELGRALGKPLPGGGGQTTARAVMPAVLEAQRLYAEGLERLQRRDATKAAERFESAIRADPGFPGAWLALAQAYELLGAERRAEEAAMNAAQRSNGLPELQRLTTEATYLRIARRRPEAVDRMRRAYEISRHAFATGLALCETQARAGQSREALATLAELRREHPEERGDPRLAMLEAEAYATLEDYRNEKGAAERALAAARSRGMVQVEVIALHDLAIARIRTGSAADCRPALADLALARRQAEATGDRFLVANVLQNFGAVSSECEDPAGSEQAYRQAIDLYREVGAQGKLPALLYNLGNVRLGGGDLLGADSLMREALDTCQAQATLCRERFLHPVGVNRLHRGELAEARRMIDEGIERNLKTGNRNRVAEARGFLTDLAFWSGDPAQAVELQRQVLVLRQDVGAPRKIAWAHSDLATWLAEAGHGAEATEQARQAIAMAAQQGETTLNACSRASLALADLVSGDLAGADRESARAIALLHPPRQPLCSFRIWQVRARTLLARGQLDAAGALIDQGLELARRNGFVTYELQGRLLQAELALARGRSEEARQLATDLATEARAKGFGVIAQRCGLLLKRAPGWKN